MWGICSLALCLSTCAAWQIICQLEQLRPYLSLQYVNRHYQTTAHPSPTFCDFWLFNLLNLANTLSTCATLAILQVGKRQLRLPEYGLSQPCIHWKARHTFWGISLGEHSLCWLLSVLTLCKKDTLDQQFSTCHSQHLAFKLCMRSSW